jgi:precorrin-6B C5,15-methyltransferase / cobalt-precorrin-6B C5,C15-methyltransferase
MPAPLSPSRPVDYNQVIDNLGPFSSKGRIVSAAESKIHILGIGNDGLAGLTSRARSLLTSAQLILGSEPVLDLLAELPAERVRLGSDLQELVNVLTANLGRKRMVIVASGDPLFYGVARYLCDKLGKEYFEVLPHVSSMQLAFARIKESWDEAYLTNLASHPLDDVLDRVRTAELVGLFTSEKESPPVIARALLARGLDYFRVYVCENLGAPDERVTQGELSDIQELEFAPLNVMILKRKDGRPDLQATSTRFSRFGNPDDLFAQSQPKSGLITRSEVRAIALAQLNLRSTSIMWDIGAGSGSVAIEAAQLAPQGTVYAIEQDVADHNLIVANAQTFGVQNLKAVHGSAPAVFAGLQAPDAIFVGGTGHEINRLLASAFEALRPSGKLVANVATLESLTATYAAFKQLGKNVQVLMVNIAQGVEQMETLRFEAINPTFLLSIAKG